MNDLLRGATARLTPGLYDVPDSATADALDRMARRLEDTELGRMKSGLEIVPRAETPSEWGPLSPEEESYLNEGGWSLVTVSDGGGRDGGMTSHRGVLSPDEEEYLDAQGHIEAEFGFTYEQIRSVYRQGRLTADALQLRAEIDARLLELSRSGGNMLLLAKAFGWALAPADDGGGPSSRTMERALARARQAEGE